MTGSEQKPDFGQLIRELRYKGFIDERYPVEGCLVWMPYGYRYKEQVYQCIENRFQESGYEPYQFPRLIQEEPLEKVRQSIYDFTEGVFWLSDKDGNRYGQYLTPTGETAIYPMFDEWINHESDLPLRVYQRGSIFRPRKSPNILLNNRDKMDVSEAHGSFSTWQDMESEFQRLHQMMNTIHDSLAIPTLPLLRPQQGNKPVYESMISYETYLPSKKKSAFIGMLYKQGQIYTEALDVTYRTTSGEVKHPYQITFGFTDRVVLAMLDLHRDDAGFRLLPQFAPIQISIVPVYDGDYNDELDEYTKNINNIIDQWRTERQTSSKTPGAMLKEGYGRGIPIQITASPENMDSNTVRIIRRTRRDDPIFEVCLEQLNGELSDHFETVEADIQSDAIKRLNDSIQSVSTLDELDQAIESRHIASLCWCQSEKCQNELESEFDGEILGRALYSQDGKCIVCGESVNHQSYFSIRTSAA